MFYLTEEQTATLGYIVNYYINHDGVPSIPQLARALKIENSAANKRKKALIEKGYLSPNSARGRGGYQINHSFFCTTRITALFLLAYSKLRILSKYGFVIEEYLLEETKDSIFDRNIEDAIHTLQASIDAGYLSRHHERASQIECDNCLADHHKYLLLISKKQ